MRVDEEVGWLVIPFDKRVMVERLRIGIVEIKIGYAPGFGRFANCFQFPYIGKVDRPDRGDILRVITYRISCRFISRVIQLILQLNVEIIGIIFRRADDLADTRVNRDLQSELLR